MAVVHKTSGMHVRKHFTAKVALTEPAGGGQEETGTFEAVVSVFGNEDSYGDIVEPGAFTKTLAEWVVKGRPIPVVWSHQFQDPDNFLGHYVDAEATETELRMKGVLDLTHPRAARVHKLMEQELITEFSWSGLVREAEWIEDDDSWWMGMRIQDIDLWEAGPTFKGANPETELLSIKNDGRLAGRLAIPDAAKAGRVLSQKNLDALIAARDQLTTVIESAKAEPEEEGEPEQDGDEPETEAEKSAPTDQAPFAASHSVRALLALSTTN